MKKTTKIWLIIAGVCIAVGILLGTIGFLVGGKGGFAIYSNGKIEYEHNFVNETSEHYQDITKLKVDVDNYAIQVAQSNDNTFSFAYNYDSNMKKPEITKEGSSLEINRRDDDWNWFNFNFFNWDEHKLLITVYVPKDTKLEDLSIHSQNGAVEFTTPIATDSLYIKTSNGKITLQNVTVTNSTTLTTSNGRIECDGTFNGKSELHSSNGTIVCKGVYKDSTDIDTSNGKIQFDGSFTGEFKGESSNGAIDASFRQDRTQCNIEAKTSNGSVYINDAKQDEHYSENNHSDNKISLRTSNGRINLDFNK